MKIFFTVFQTSVILIFRDKKTLLMVLILPLLQVLIFGYAITNKIADLPVAVVGIDGRHYPSLEQKIQSSEEFSSPSVNIKLENLHKHFSSDQIRAAIILPPGIEYDVLAGVEEPIQLVIDGSNPNESALIGKYLEALLREHFLEARDSIGRLSQIAVEMRFNPGLDAVPNFLTGVVAVIVMLIAVMMSSSAIVRERSSGTIHLFLSNGCPVSVFVIGKSLPYLVLSLINISIYLWVGVCFMGLPFKGSVLLVLLVSNIFVFTCIALGILVASLTSSMTVALLVTLIAMVVPTMMFSGFMFPLGNMPFSLQLFSLTVPSKWFYDSIQLVMVRGATLAGCWIPLIVLLFMSISFLSLALINFKRRYRWI